MATRFSFAETLNGIGFQTGKRSRKYQSHYEGLPAKQKFDFYFFVSEKTNAIREPTWDEIRDHNVIITTLASARMLWRFYQDGRLRFTHILIDEAAQALEPECVTPLVMVDGNTKIVLAGDHKQVR